jgi:hypothetical protein
MNTNAVRLRIVGAATVSMLASDIKSHNEDTHSHDHKEFHSENITKSPSHSSYDVRGATRDVPISGKACIVNDSRLQSGTMT